MESFLLVATIYLLSMVIAVPLSARLGLGSVLGYLISGIVIGPVLGLAGSEGEMADLQHFAEFGVVMMLFLIGLELEPRTLWQMRKRLIGLAGMQILGTMALLTAVCLLLNQSWQVSVTLGMILSLSSTAIVLQTLSEKQLMQTAGGRSAFAVLLTQDIAVIPMIALMPLLATRALPGAEGCMTNQVYYSLSQRGIEFDLLPWQRAHRMPLMAYSPIDQGTLAAARGLAPLAERHRATPAQIALAWLLARGDVIAIPKAVRETHLRDNLAAA
ncbi:MAG TPA: aldo/keto reductase, partial [Paracoccus sp. (in: a-proteobacteria)]|nr:aldo/keto reductase [Paracoccus sp. (in: a-proteobacteria)]